MLAATPAVAQPLPSVREMAAAREDVWGEAALRHPGGPSYEFFNDLLPPLRYVNTAFRHYPIVLCAPGNSVKTRWVSNGSGVNLRASKPPMWREVGTPVSFFIGEGSETFGAQVERLDGPRYTDGCLPIVYVKYSLGAASVEQEAFGLVSRPLADHGAVFVRFTSRQQPGRIAARIETKARLAAIDNSLRDENGRSLVAFGSSWHFDKEKKELSVSLATGASADLLVMTKPLEGALTALPNYDDERRQCIATWKALLGRGSTLEIPEPIVQNAWRALVIGNYLIAVGDRMNYSAGNAYDHLYEGECGDAVRSLMLFGHAGDARRMIGPLLAFNRKATRFHVAGHKLQLLAHYYMVTRDADYIREQRAIWEQVVAFIRNSRNTGNGLLPKDNYAGDINQQIYSLNSNANCWRGLRDMAAVLDDIGERDAASGIRAEADAFRKVILDAVAKSERKDSKPPFIPLSLFGNEQRHDPLTATRTGSYYDLMIPYVLGAEIFANRERETWIIDYLRQHGGLSMGMIRSMPHQGEFKDHPGVNVLYGLRYNLTLLRRGDRGHALVGFYGHLAQAMTRDTFIGGEGSRFLHGDEFGRSFYLPPNSASNAAFLTTLRYLLIQDWDLDGDGEPETLRLLDAVPPRWLNDGSDIRAGRMPTAFGELSFTVESRLRQNEIVVSMQRPERPLKRWQLRLPDPPGYRIVRVFHDDNEVQRDAEGRVDVPRGRKDVRLRFVVQSTKGNDR